MSTEIKKLRAAMEGMGIEGCVFCPKCDGSGTRIDGHGFYEHCGLCRHTGRIESSPAELLAGAEAWLLENKLMFVMGAGWHPKWWVHWRAEPTGNVIGRGVSEDNGQAARIIAVTQALGWAKKQGGKVVGNGQA